MVNAQAFFVWFIDLPVSFFQKSCEKLAIKILHNIICNISLAAHFIHPEWQVNGMAYDPLQVVYVGNNGFTFSFCCWY